MNSAEAYNRCVEALIWALSRLEVQAESHHVEQVADFIVRPMTGPWRYFHTPQHIFEVGGYTGSLTSTTDPIEVLAALFHDLVYVQVDGSINFNLSHFITPFVREVDGKLWIRPTLDLPVDRNFELVLLIFGFEPDSALNPYGGQNEFLSAVVAVKILEPWVPPPQLAAIAAAIEATVPFRATAGEQSVSEALEQRLLVANQRFGFGWIAEQVQQVVKQAARVANRDLEGFAHFSPAHFLANTWNLLPETNHNLVHTGVYRVSDYRLALHKMEGFMQAVRPEVIFRHYLDEPDTAIYQQLLQRAAYNLEVARLYLMTKVVAIALLEALSWRLGADVPLSVMMGELKKGEHAEGHRLEDFLVALPTVHHPHTPLEHEVYELLVLGRAKSRTENDLQESPLAAFLVRAIGFDAIRQHRVLTQQWLTNALPLETFLLGFEPELVEAIVAALDQLFEARRKSICSFYPSIRVVRK